MSHLFKGELQLLRWSETSNAGATLTFQLSDVRDLDAFKNLTLAKKGMCGQRIASMMMLVDELDSAIEDAETVYVAYEEPIKVQDSQLVSPKNKPGQLCVMACTFCADPDFQYWTGAGDEPSAKQLILGQCGITSRKELDTNKDAAAIFHRDFREKFLDWKNKK